MSPISISVSLHSVSLSLLSLSVLCLISPSPWSLSVSLCDVAFSVLRCLPLLLCLCGSGLWLYMLSRCLSMSLGRALSLSLCLDVSVWLSVWLSLPLSVSLLFTCCRLLHAPTLTLHSPPKASLHQRSAKEYTFQSQAKNTTKLQSERVEYPHTRASALLYQPGS